MAEKKKYALLDYKSYGDFKHLEEKREADLKNDQADLDPDPTPIAPDFGRPNNDQSRPNAVQPSNLDGQKTVQKSLDVQVRLDVQKREENFYCPSRTDRTKLTLRLPNHKINKYKKWAFEHRISLQDLFELALDKILDGQITLDGQKNLDGNFGRPKDDRSDHDSDIDIDDRSVDGQKLNLVLDFYKQWTGNNIRPKDEITYLQIAEIDLMDIKIGILQSIKYSNTPVRMFSYCVKTILNNSRQKKPRYKYDKQQQLLDLINELKEKEHS